MVVIQLKDDLFTRALGSIRREHEILKAKRGVFEAVLHKVDADLKVLELAAVKLSSLAKNERIQKQA